MECFVFPLQQTNLFPLTTKPLNIFEARYIKMINDSIDQGIPIALGYVPENGDTYRSIAGFGMPQIIDQRPDGSLLVFMIGQGKIRLNPREDHPSAQTSQQASSSSGLHQEVPYIKSQGEVIYDDLQLNDELKNKYMVLSQLLVRWVQKHVPDSGQREIFVRSLKGPQEIIGAFASYLIRDYDLQYEMMEIFSLNEQINFLYRLFESNELTN